MTSRIQSLPAGYWSAHSMRIMITKILSKWPKLAWNAHENSNRKGENPLPSEFTQRSTHRPSPRLYFRTRRTFNVMLGTSLVHYYPPKHHARALRILDEILSEDDVNVPSLMGRAYILQASRDWITAEELFLRVTELLSDDVDQGIRAREEHAWCMLQQGGDDVAEKELKTVSEVLDDLEDREVDQARCWWRMGKCAWQAEGLCTLPPLFYSLTWPRRLRGSIPMFHHGSETLSFLCPRVF